MTKREQLEADAKELREKAEALEEQIKALPAEEGRWKPQPGDTYWTVYATAIRSVTWNGDSDDVGRYSKGFVFKTRKEAEFHKLRLESMAASNPPIGADGGYYWIWAFGLRQPHRQYDQSIRVAMGLASIGNMHETAEEARAWYDKYGEAWEALLK